MRAMSDAANGDQAPATGSRAVEVRASEDGVEVETEDSLGSEIVLIPWDQAVRVARRIIEFARARGDLT
jgi:hypothetical protein